MAVLHRVRTRSGDRLTLISVGGVTDADDVWDRLVAGATLVQAYTGFIYGGPLWPRRINRALAKRLEASEFDRIADVVGSGSSREKGRES
jgi:dihydroorotate dehydrogenase